jgi:hypothetical protein
MSNHFERVFVQYFIKKGNTNEFWRIYDLQWEKKEKSRRFLRIRMFSVYLSPGSSVLSRGTHWMSWWSPKYQKFIPKPNSQKSPNQIAGFQKLKLDLSDRPKIPRQSYLSGFLHQTPKSFAGHVWPLDRSVLSSD